MRFPVNKFSKDHVKLLKNSKKLVGVCHASSSTTSRYHEEYQRSLQNPSDYWAEAAENLVWFKKWDKVLDTSKAPFTDWFVGGEINHSYNCIDRHIDEGEGDQLALIHDSPVTNSLTKITYNQLLEKVSSLAGELVKSGVKKGDRVLIYMPMIPEAVVAMQATVRIGALHVVVFGGFAAKELSVRIDHCKPTAVISASCGIEPSRVVPYKPILDEALNMSKHKPKRVVIYQRPEMEPAKLNRPVDVDWSEVMAAGLTHDCVPVESNHPMYILYTSGTTGDPKGTVRPTGPHCVRLRWTMDAIYDVKPGEVHWTAADVGWGAFHSYGAYGPLLNRSTSIVFEASFSNYKLGKCVTSHEEISLKNSNVYASLLATLNDMHATAIRWKLITFAFITLYKFMGKVVWSTNKNNLTSRAQSCTGLTNSLSSEKIVVSNVLTWTVT